VPAADPLRLPLSYQAEPVGELLLGPRGAGEAFGPADRRLLDDLARQAGVAVHAVRLTADLQHSRQRLVTAREEERRRLRRDLHDGLGPELASMTLQAEAARDCLPEEPTRSDALLAELIGQLQAATAEIRRLVYELRPPALDDLGLVAALRTLAARYDHGGPPGLRITVAAPEPLAPLPAAVEVATYRICQEALTNVVRHAAARQCSLRLARTDTDGRDAALVVEIRDDGRGLAAEQRAGVGLASMRERAAELGGRCLIEPVPAGGTRVLAMLPLAALPPAPVATDGRRS
jgi:signal transduction histidine kinase